MRVLIIENESFLAENLCQYLCDLPCIEGEYVTSRHDAMQRLSEKRYDLVLTDLNLPDTSGDEWILEIGSRRPGQKIVVMSSYPVPECLKSSDCIEVIAYLEKPFDIHALVSIIMPQ
ncbi:MAG: response regulator [candidate division KSB1 bacterium]|jgi:DNA-binding NtrC family response regulator|nr:response regulator [candidate division KSB1 bacterium]